MPSEIDIELATDRSRISKNFTRAEFTCRCGCGRFCAQYELIIALEEIRAELGGTSLNITKLGGFRCNGNSVLPNWNEQRGGAKLSWHTVGGGADLYHTVYRADQLYDYLCMRYPDRYGKILYPSMNFCHFDIRPDAPYNTINQAKYT